MKGKTYFTGNGKKLNKLKSYRSIALNALFIPHNMKDKRYAYTSKDNSKCPNRVILLMITYGEKWHNVVLKNLSRLLRGMALHRDGGYYCINCPYSSNQTKQI